jgi:sulfur carrier protein
MLLQINGHPKEVPDALTVTGLLAFLALKTDRVAVEVNAEVVARAKHAQTLLKPGDAIEVVTFVGGG